MNNKNNKNKYMNFVQNMFIVVIILLFIYLISSGDYGQSNVEQCKSICDNNDYIYKGIEYNYDDVMCECYNNVYHYTEYYYLISNNNWRLKNER